MVAWAGLLNAAPATAPAATNAVPSFKSEFESPLIKPGFRDPFFPKTQRPPYFVKPVEPTKPSGPNEPPKIVDCYTDIIVKGISISATRRIATINNQAFAAGNELPVKTPHGTVKLKVIEIKDRSVIVKAENCEPKELLFNVR